MRTSRQDDIWALFATIAADQPEAVIPINHEKFVIGRDPGLDLTIPSQFVSSKHAELSTKGGRLFVLDLSSKNGVLVNGKRIGRCEVGVGDIIRVAEINFRVDHLDKGKAGSVAVTNWVASQFPKLFEDNAVSTLLDPVYDLQTRKIAGCQMVIQSQVSGLETMERMFAAARTREKETELAALCLKQYSSVTKLVTTDCDVYLSTPMWQNLPMILMPALRDWRGEFTRCRPIVEIHNAARRTLRSLQNFQHEIQELEFRFALASFGLSDLEVVRKSNITPACVVLDPALTMGIAARSDAERRQLTTLMDLLRFHGILARATSIVSQADEDVCREVGITQAQGPHLGTPVQLPLPAVPQSTTAFRLDPVEEPAAADLNDVTAEFSLGR